MRGVERRDIFVDDVDRNDFVSRLARQLIEGQGSCLAWVLMPNHAHLLLRTGIRPLSNVMRRLNGGYARAFNLRHGRFGYLFQDRFRSYLVEDDAYLRVLIRYIHLNPLRAGMVGSVDALEAYPWGGYAELMSSADTACLVSKNEVLAQFGPTFGEARLALRAWMRAGESSTSDGEYLAWGDSRSIAGAGIDDAARNGHITWEPSGILEPTPQEIRANRLRAGGWTLDSLITWVCASLSADPVAVRTGQRKVRDSKARAIIAALATRELGLHFAFVAKATGVTPSAVCHAIENGVAAAEEKGIRLDESGPPAT